MQMDGYIGVFQKISNWAMRFVYTNVLWIIFSVLGIVIFGFFPATIAMFTLMRKWIMGDEDIPIFKTFWHSFRKEFVKGNFLGLILCMVGYILYIDFQYFKLSMGSMQFIYFPLVIFTLLYFMMLLFIFPTYVHYDVNVFRVIKNASLIMIMNPITTLVMIGGSLVIYYLMTAIPGLIPFFGGSVLSLFMMWTSLKAFVKTQNKIETVMKKSQRRLMMKNN